MTKEKAIIILTVTIDVIGLGIIIPVLPTYVKSLGLSPFYVTLLFSVFSLFSFLSAPFLGAVSDKIGRRPVLIISIASTSLGWLIFSMAKSFPILLLGRIIDGLAAGNISTAQSAITDVSKDAKDRAGNLGIIGMIFGLGFIIGPFIGGILSQVSPSFPFLFVAILALINTILAYFFVPETNNHLDPLKKISWNPLTPLLAAINNHQLRKLYLIWFLISIITVGGNSVFALYLGAKFGYQPVVTGLFFTGIGVVLALNQGLLLKKFWLQKFKEKQLILIMLGLLASGFTIMAIGNIGLFILGMVLTAFGQSTIGVPMTNEVVSQADIKAKGEAVGILIAIGSIANIVSPIINGAAFELKLNLPYILAAVLSAITFGLMKRKSW